MNDQQKADRPSVEDYIEQYDDGPRGVAAIFGPTVNAIFAPQAAFETIAARPILAIWPVIWVTLSAVIMGLVNADITRQTFRIGMIEGMQRQGQEIDPEQIRPMLEGIDRWAPVIAPVNNLFLVLFVVLVAVFLWIGSSVSGGSTRFIKAFGVAAVGAVITPALLILFMTVVWTVDPPEFRRIEEFTRATPTLSLALLFVDEETPIWLTTILQSISLFNIWWIYVTAVGARVLLEIKGAGAWALPFVVWLLMTGAGAGLATLGSG
ncbi:MAG: hypothetical protein GKS06_07405 [Acidobacteria bacterium]|nr:hypothetical protein [Acidobacteriota bacterium]